MITRYVEKIEIWELRDKELDDLTETDMKELENDKKEEDNDAYAEHVDYNASQESVESFDTKVGVKTTGENSKEADTISDEALRRCDRLADKQDAKIADLAKERVAAKDDYGINYELSAHNFSLLFMADRIGIDLGCSIGLINQNLDIIAKMEQSRKDFYIQNIANKGKKEEDQKTSLIDTGDVDLKELCSDEDHSDAEMEMDYFAHLQKIFSSGKKITLAHQGVPG